MRFFHLLWFNCQFIFAIFLKVSICLVYLLSCESEAPRSDSSTLRRAFWHPEEEFLFAGKDPDSEPALSAEGQQGIHADHTQTHTRSSNNAEETQTHTHIRQIESVWTWENTCTQWAHTPPPPSSCSLNLDYTRHQGGDSSFSWCLLLDPVVGRFAHKEAERARLTWGAQWPGVGGPERATAPGPLGWAPLPPLSPSSPPAPRAAHLGTGDMGRDSNGLGTTGRGGEDEKLKAWNSSSVWDARVTLCQVRWRREEGREGAVIRWF